MIQSVESYIKYVGGIRRRTLVFAQAIPADQIEWAPQEDAFTFGDILRHLAAVENMTICAVINRRWEVYPGHGQDLAHGLDEIIPYLERTHADAMNTLRTLPDSELQQPRTALGGRSLSAWRLLMSIIEHEIHHRSQLASYLTMLGVTPPQIFGLGVDDVVAMSAQLSGDQTLSHEPFFEQAIRLALEAEQAGNLPIGAVISLDGEIIAEGKNAIWHPHYNPNRHAEIEALRDVPQRLWKSAREMTLYTTLEPCLMCTGAILLHQIGRVLYGSADPYGGGGLVFGHMPTYFEQEVSKIEWLGPVYAHACDKLYERVMVLENRRARELRNEL